MTTAAAVPQSTLEDPTPQTPRPRPTEFLHSWFAGCPADQLLELRAIHAATKSVQQAFYAIDAVQQLYGDACRLAEDHDAYYGVCPRTRPQGRNEDVTHAPGFWADLDFKRFVDGEAGALRKLAAFRLKPTWIIATGGGFHLYWKLDAVVRWDAKMQGRLRGLVKMLDADHTTDRARVLRVPGTFNHKYQDCQVSIVSWPTD